MDEDKVMEIAHMLHEMFPESDHQVGVLMFYERHDLPAKARTIITACADPS